MALFSPYSRFCCQGAFYGPTIAINSLGYRSAFQSKPFSPLAQWEGFLSESNQSCNRAITHLLRNGFPFDVIRFVITIVIDAANCVFRTRGTPHIGQEVFKHRPTTAYGDATPSVSWFNIFSGIFTSPNHSPPRLPFFRSFSSERLPMPKSSLVGFHGAIIQYGELLWHSQ